jgi:hypothetical protein
MNKKVRWGGRDTVRAIGGVLVEPGGVIEIPEEVLVYLPFADKWTVLLDQVDDESEEE